jgi:hypothetical protein
LAEARFDEIEALADRSSAVLSALTSRLYEADARDRFRAAEALGRASRRWWGKEPDRVSTLLRKLVWSLNDESGATAWGAPQAIGEVVRNDAALAAEYAPLLISYLDNEDIALETDIMVQGLVYALGRVGEKHRLIGQECVPTLIRHLRDPDPTTMGLAVWALGLVGDARAVEVLGPLMDDATPMQRYEAGEMADTSIGALAREALVRVSDA